MRKLILQMQLGMDGDIAGFAHEMGWMEQEGDEALKEYVLALARPVDTILLGRKLAESFIPRWTRRSVDPATTDEFSRKMATAAKFVFTRTISSCRWFNTELVHSDLGKTVGVLKAQRGGDMIAYGGSDFAGSLIKNGLVDDYHFLINPTAIGRDIRILSQVEPDRRFRLLDCKRFDCGVSLLHYGK